MDPLRDLEKRLRAAAPAALKAGAEACAAAIRADAGPLAPGVAAGPVRVEGDRVECDVISAPVDGEMPPFAREFGTRRTSAQPYMRAHEHRVGDVIDPIMVRRLANP